MRDAALQEEISRALSNPGSPTLEELDRLLTDCAAEALRLHGEIARVQREIDATLTGQRATEPESKAQAPTLLLRRRRLAAEGRQLSRLMETLRELRDRVAGSAAADG